MGLSPRSGHYASMSILDMQEVTGSSPVSPTNTPPIVRLAPEMFRDVDDQRVVIPAPEAA